MEENLLFPFPIMFASFMIIQKETHGFTDKFRKNI